MTKNNKWIYLIATGLFTANMALSAGMYIFNNPFAAEKFEALHFPTYIIYPLAIAKILGCIAIWSKKSTTLKEWAYAGFVFELILAFTAHLNIGDGEAIPALIALVLVLTSYTLYKTNWKKEIANA